MADTNERLQQAIAAARAGNTDEARELVDSLVEDNPDNPHALFLRGMLASSQEEQLDYLNRVLEIDPDHKAANRRLAQIAPAEAEDATVLIIDEPEEIEEPEAVEDIEAGETVVGAGALFAAEDDLAEEPAEEHGEWDVAETVVTAAAVGAGIEVLEDDTTMVDPAFSEETFLEEDPAEEEEPSDGVDETVITAAAAAGVVLAADQDEEIPDWLMAESRSEEELAETRGQDIWGEPPAEEVQELPDWLTEEPSDAWVETEPEDATVFAAAEAGESDLDDTWANEVEDQDAGADQVELAEVEATEDDTVIEGDEDEEAGEEKPKKKSSTRGLEIALVILIVFALLIVVGLILVVLNLF